MLESIFDTNAANQLQVGTREALLCIAVALVLGLFISVIYMYGDRTRRKSHHFAIALVILPAIMAIVIMMIGSDIARALSLGGVFALVRFRSVPGNSRDIAIIFFAMTIGLGCGMGYPVFSGMAALIIAAAYLVLSRIGYGSSGQIKKQLKITVPEDLNFEGAFDDVFSQYATYIELVRAKTVNLGSLYELTYDLVLKADISQKAFLDELRCRNGNLNIMLGNPETEENML